MMTDSRVSDADEVEDQDVDMQLEQVLGDEDDDEDYFDDEDEDVDDEDEEDEDDDRYPSRRSVFTFPPATSPQAAGVNLIKSGEFGRIAPKIRARRNNRNLASVLSNRLTSPHPALYKEQYSAVCIFHSDGFQDSSCCRTLFQTPME